MTTVYLDQLNVETPVRATLAGITGVGAPSVIQSPFYQAAARQMAKVTGYWAGGGLVDQEMKAIIVKWTARGLSGPVLTQIAYEVLHWTQPGP